MQKKVKGIKVGILIKEKEEKQKLCFFLNNQKNGQVYRALRCYTRSKGFVKEK